MIELSNELIEKIQKRIEGTDFKNISEYIEYILTRVLSKVESVEKNKQPEPSESDQKKVQERLKRLASLGYLD